MSKINKLVAAPKTVQAVSRLMQKEIKGNSKLSYLPNDKTKLSWELFSGGPKVVGPVKLIIDTIQAGKVSKIEGIKMLLKYLKDGTFKINR
jgi:hypothetical protein